MTQRTIRKSVLTKKQQSVVRGTLRRIRRQKAQSEALRLRIYPKDFPRFWHYGATTDAATRVHQENLDSAKAKKNRGQEITATVDAS